MIKRLKTQSGTTVIIHYIESIEKTIDTDLMSKSLSEIENNIKSFTNKEIFSNLTIEIYDPEGSDFPKDLSAGLTYFGRNYIQLSSKHHEYTYSKYISNLISHEFFHYFSESIGFFKYQNDRNNIANQIFNTMCSNQFSIISKVEFIAEIGRYFYGSDEAKGFDRGNYQSIRSFKGLKDLLAIWKRLNDFQYNLPWPTYISEYKLIYSEADSNYIAVELNLKSYFMPWLNQKIIFKR